MQYLPQIIPGVKVEPFLPQPFRDTLFQARSDFRVTKEHQGFVKFASQDGYVDNATWNGPQHVNWQSGYLSRNDQSMYAAVAGVREQLLEADRPALDQSRRGLRPPPDVLRGPQRVHARPDSILRRPVGHPQQHQRAVSAGHSDAWRGAGDHGVESVPGAGRIQRRVVLRGIRAG